MITSHLYLIAAYLFATLLMLGASGFYLWRNVALARRFKALTQATAHKPEKTLLPLLLRLLPFLCFVFFVVMIVIQLAATQQPDRAQAVDVMVGQSAPALTLPLLNPPFQEQQATVTMPFAEFSAGRVTLVNFWASWCVPCHTEHPLLMQLAQDPRLDLIGINYKDNDKNAAQFLHQRGNPFLLVAADRRGRGAIEWGVYGIPETYLVDEKGIITYRHIGPLTPAILTRELLPAIEKAATASFESQPL